jgi:hypothetical protein
LFCEKSKGISRVQLSDNSISLLLNQERFPDDAYVITSGDNIYHTNNTTNTVSCHKINGDKLWEFQNVANCTLEIPFDFSQNNNDPSFCVIP